MQSVLTYAGRAKQQAPAATSEEDLLMQVLHHAMGAYHIVCTSVIVILLPVYSPPVVCVSAVQHCRRCDRYYIDLSGASSCYASVVLDDTQHRALAVKACIRCSLLHCC
jgi:hypothetical protein